MLSKTLRTLGFIALLLLPSFAGAEQTFFRAYDLNATDYTYGKFGEWGEASPSRIETSGSSTTVTAVSGTPFELVGVGDEIRVELTPGTQTRRVVTAVASSISITVDSAINLDVDGGYKFEWRDFTSGTAATDGWQPVIPGTSSTDVYVYVTTMTGTDGIDVQIECKADGDASTGIAVVTVNYAAAGSAIYPISEVCSAIRVGLKWATADTAGTDVISVFLVSK